jgi:hypothetical protein
MGPRDRPSPLPDGASCTACGAPVPTGRIRLLARRDGVAFVRLVCDDCGSAAIGLLLDVAGDDPVLDVATDLPWPGRLPAGRGTPAITQAEVDAVRRDLAGWDGDLVGWLDR